MITENNFKRIKILSETSGTSGFESNICDVIKSELTGLSVDISTDNLGNLTVFKRGKIAKKVMVAAHMDEIGFIVSHIDENGFIRFHPLGGFDPKTLTAQRVIIHGKKDIIGVMGSKPIHLMKAEERSKNIELTDFFIDTGLHVEQVKNIVDVGNAITRERELIEMGNCYNGKSLDNRISVYVLETVLKMLNDTILPFDLYAVFTVQEELGLRGAQVATQSIEPDIAIALDTTIAFDLPGAQPHEMITKLGDGTSIKIMDASAVSNVRLVNFIKETAQLNKIKFQSDILLGGGTDIGSIQRMVKGGAVAGGLSIPTRHIHQVVESVNKNDVIDTVNLLTCILIDIDKLKLD